MARKIKVNKKKRLNAIKRGWICIGIDGETNEPILINARTSPLNRKNYHSMVAKIYENFKIPKTVKKPLMFNREEKRLFKVYGQLNDKDEFIIHDTTSPEYCEKVEEIENLKAMADAISGFDMDATNLDEESGEDISNWELWGLPNGNWFALLKFLSDEEKGLGLNFGNIAFIVEEMKSLKMGKPTTGENIIEALYGDVEVNKSIVDKIAEEVQGAIDTKVEELTKDVKEEVEADVKAREEYSDSDTEE